MELIHYPDFECRACGEFEVYECTPCEWSWCVSCGEGNTCRCRSEVQE